MSPAPYPRRPLIEELEPRLLFSADLAPCFAEGFVPSGETRIVDSAGEFTNTGDTQQQTQFTRLEVVFIDSRVDNYQQILADIHAQNTDHRSIEVVLLDSEADGVAQISALLSQRQAIDAVHIISHGADGALQLGSNTLNLDSLLEHAAAIKQWASALSEHADILLYGCNVAESADGKALVNALAQLTAADVAASDDLTGSAALGGNWTLEYRTGAIEAAMAPSAQAAATWSGLLASVSVTTTNDVLDGNTTSIAALLAAPGMDGSISLREAIIATNNTAGADQIVLSAGTYAIAISGAGENSAQTGDFDIADSAGLTLTGMGIGTTILDGSGLDRIFDVMGNTPLTASDLTIRNGSSGTVGGGIYMHSGTTLTLTRVAVTGNTGTLGGGLYLASSTTATLTDVDVSGNVATSAGGAILNDGVLTFTRGLVSGNSASSGGGIESVNNSSVLDLTNVTVSGNAGGGLYVKNSVTAINCTIYGNTGLSGISKPSGPVPTNSFKNTIFANNGAGNSTFTLTSAGGNIEDANSCGFNQATDLVNTNPDLGALQDNGGSTLTHAVLVGSPAINHGVAAGAPAADQRGIARDAQVDTGAYEYVANNTAPSLDDTKSPALTAQNEDSGPPSGAVGTAVSSLVDFTAPAGQLDNVTDPDPGALLGVAITAADTSNGSWWYSNDNGTNWYALGAVANANTRLLAADATTRLYFQPNANYSGTLVSAIRFRAWDQSSGSNGGTADTTSNGGSTAFSTAIDTASLVVNPIVDTPAVTNATTDEDTQTVSGLVISRNAADGVEVTHFKITGIANGTLYKNDGVTQITNGSFITFAEGNAGLKFTPTSNFNGSGSFTVQASTSNNDSGLGGSTVNATITVNSVNDAPSFGVGDGKVMTPVSSANDVGYELTLQPDGKILIVGSAWNGSNDDFAVVRYNADGSLDTSFGAGGKVTTAVGAGRDWAHGAAVQADGKIVVGGRSFVGGDDDFAVVRYNADGTLDNSFGSGGKVTTAIGANNDVANYLVLQADGKIVMAGRSNNGSNFDFALVRYNSDGTLDTSFGSGGKITTAIGSGDDIIQGISVQADGKLVVAGRSFNGADWDFGVARYNTDGSLDTSFGSGGMLTTAIGSNDQASSVMVQPDGRIVVAGIATLAGNDDFAVVRYNVDGSLDTSFGSGGKLTTAIGAGSDQAHRVALQADGKIVLAGMSNNGSNNDFALVRYNADGTLDASFGSGGKVTVTIGPGNDVDYGLGIQTDGRIVTGTYASNGSNNDFALACFNSDGSLDPDFDTAILNGRPTYTEGGAAVVLDSDVQIFDVELSAANDFSGATLTLVRNGGANAADVFSASGNLSALTEGGNLVLSGVTLGTVTTNSAGTLLLAFNANATQVRVNETLQSIAYANLSDAPPPSVTINWTFSDGNLGAQGSGSTAYANGSTTVQIIPVNDPPTTGLVTLAPVAEDSGPRLITQAELLANASDVDGPALSATGLAIVSGGGSLVDNGNGTWTYTPALNDDSSVSFSYTVADGSLSAAGSAALDLTPANDAPTVANAISNQPATEDAPFSFQFAANTFNDVDVGDSLSYSASGLPAWLNFDAGTRTFSGTPSNNDVGTVTVTVRATDGAGAWVENQFDLVVANTNDAPTLVNAIPNQAVTEDAPFSFTFAANSFNDVDVGDSLGYSASGVPAWLSFDGATRTFSGTPSNSDVGTATITVRATDINGAWVEDQFDLVVANINDAPTLVNTIPNQAATEDAPFSFTFAANTFNDVDVGDSLGYSASGLPAWLSFDGASRTFSGTPTNSDVGTATITARATDINGAWVEDQFDLVVANINDAPTVANAIPDQAATENSAFNFQFAANTFNDVDVGDALGYSASGLPVWLNFNAGTRTFSGTPTNSDVGVVTVTARATDISGAWIEDQFDIVVASVANAPTIVTGGSSGMGNEDTLIASVLAATDADGLTDGTCFAVVSQATNGVASIDAATGAWSYVPNADFHGLDSFSVRITDDIGNTTTQVISLTINPVADTPAVTNATTDEDTQTASGLVISRNAADGVEVTHFKITGITNGTLYKSDGVTQVANGGFVSFAEGNAGLQFRPTADFNGTGSFTVQASTANNDSGVGGSTVDATIIVNALVDIVTDTAATGEGTAVVTTALANDSFEGIPTVTGVTQGAHGVVIIVDANLGTLRYIPDANFSGSDTYTYTVTSGGVSETATVDVTVNPLNPVTPGNSAGQANPINSPVFMAPIADVLLSGQAVAPPPSASPVDTPAQAPQLTQTALNAGSNTDHLQSASVTQSDNAVDVQLAVPELHTSLLVLTANARTGHDVPTDAVTQDDILLRLLEIIRSEQPGTADDNVIAPMIQIEISQDESFRVQVVRGAQLTGISLSVGAVWWALRAGGLFASLLTSLPAWRSFDVLPVLRPEEDERERVGQFSATGDRGKAKSKVRPGEASPPNA